MNAVETEHLLLCVCSISYPAFKAHALCCIVICGLSGSTTFSRGNNTEHKMCVLIFSTAIVLNISHFKNSAIYSYKYEQVFM